MHISLSIDIDDLVFFVGCCSCILIGSIMFGLGRSILKKNGKIGVCWGQSETRGSRMRRRKGDKTMGVVKNSLQGYFVIVVECWLMGKHTMCDMMLLFSGGEKASWWNCSR